VDAKTGDLSFRIQEAEGRLAELLLRYTDKYPQVVALRGTIDELKARQAEELARVRAGKGATGSLASSLKSNPIYQGLQLELKRTEVQLAELRQDLAQRSADVGGLQKLVNTVPEVEAELARLNRDYEITRTRYSELVERRETARLSESAEKQGVVKFKIIDPPTAGVKPVAPSRTIFLLAVLVGGVGTACGLMYLLNQLSSVYYNARALAEKTGLPVLGAVGRTLSQEQRVVARRTLLMFSGAASLLIVMCLVVVVWSDAGARAAQRILATV
jgi:polysaccharide chain length determinant protein (PEP-CTERM system associated)